MGSFPAQCQLVCFPAPIDSPPASMESSRLAPRAPSRFLQSGEPSRFRSPHRRLRRFPRAIVERAGGFPATPRPKINTTPTGAARMPNPPSDALVFLGATGDLAYKQIFPALQGLIRDENF